MRGRSFDLGDVLSVTTGCMVSPRGVGAIYDVLNFMTGDNLFTHQLPRACDEAKPEVLRQHPDLTEATVPDGGFRDGVHVLEWLADQVDRFGSSRDLEPMAPQDHTRINPLDELAMMAPHLKVIAVELPEGDES